MQVDVDSIDVDVPAIDQVGIVVHDLKEGMERFGTMLGIDTWRVYDFSPPELSETTFRGQERDQAWRLSLATLGEIDIELIEPIEGNNTYTHFLDEHGEGMHHLACFSFEDPATAVESYVEAGVPIEQSGVFRGSTFWYLDMRDSMHGMILEVVESGKSGPPDADELYSVGSSG